MEYRMEHDSMGQVRVPAEHSWGAQTQRSLENFTIGTEKMPPEVIRALILLKRAAAQANLRAGKLDQRRCRLICDTCDGLLADYPGAEFPLSVWQTGSGTQTNMNVNEVIAHLGNEAAGETLLHPNDHVNCSQSTNDMFPSAIHLAGALELERRLLPVLDEMRGVLAGLEEANRGVLKTGRTHLQDAVPVAFSQEIHGWAGMVESAQAMIRAALPGLLALPAGGTAAGTGLNAPAGFGDLVAEQLAEQTGLPFRSEPNKFYALSARDGAAFAHSALRALAADLLKLANDVRWLASGPRCGLGEITIPAGEPGSSIMPGKVNPTQCEALSMVCLQVMGNDAAIGFAASQGNFQLNVYMPLFAHLLLQSIRLLADAAESFTQHCLAGLTANREKMAENLSRSLMNVTALTPVIGYENGAKIAQLAQAEGLTLRQAAIELQILTGEQFDDLFHPENMV